MRLIRYHSPHRCLYNDRKCLSPNRSFGIWNAVGSWIRGSPSPPSSPSSPSSSSSPSSPSSPIKQKPSSHTNNDISNYTNKGNCSYDISTLPNVVVARHCGTTLLTQLRSPLNPIQDGKYDKSHFTVSLRDESSSSPSPDSSSPPYPPFPSIISPYSSHLLHQALRPLFPPMYLPLLDVISTLYSRGKTNPLVLAINSASLALSVSEVPWNGPIGCVEVCSHKSGKMILYPTEQDIQHAEIKLLYIGKKNKKCISINLTAKEVPEWAIRNAIEAGTKGVEYEIERQLGVLNDEVLNNTTRKSVKENQRLKECITSVQLQKAVEMCKTSVDIPQFFTTVYKKENEQREAWENTKEMVERHIYPAFHGEIPDRHIPYLIQATLRQLYHEHLSLIHKGKNFNTNALRLDGRTMLQSRSLKVEKQNITKDHSYVLTKAGNSSILTMSDMHKPSVEKNSKEEENLDEETLLTNNVVSALYPSNVVPSLKLSTKILSNDGSLWVPSLMGIQATLKEQFPSKSLLNGRIVVGNSVGVLEIPNDMSSRGEDGEGKGKKKDKENEKIAKKRIYMIQPTAIEEIYNDVHLNFARTNKGITAMHCQMTNGEGLHTFCISQALELEKESSRRLLLQPPNYIKRIQSKKLPPSSSITHVNFYSISSNQRSIFTPEKLQEISLKSKCSVTFVPSDSQRLRLLASNQSAIHCATTMLNQYTKPVTYHVGHQYNLEVKSLDEENIQFSDCSGSTAFALLKSQNIKRKLKTGDIVTVVCDQIKQGMVYVKPFLNEEAKKQENEKKEKKVMQEKVTE